MFFKSFFLHLLELIQKLSLELFNLFIEPLRLVVEILIPLLVQLLLQLPQSDRFVLVVKQHFVRPRLSELVELDSVVVIKLLLLLVQRSGQLQIEGFGQVCRHFLSCQFDRFGHVALKLQG